MADLPAVSIAKFTGLYKSVGAFSIPPGAMSVADNVVVPGPSLLQPRRGFRGLLADSVEALGNYAGDVMAYGGGVLLAVNLGDDSSTTISRGASDLTLAPALLSGFNGGASYQTKTRFLNANGNLYLTTNFGLARVTSETGTWAPAGLPQPPVPDVNALVLGFGSVTNKFLADGFQVSYRGTWRWEDPNGNVHRSAPSEKFLVSNTSGSAGYVVATFGLASMVPPGTVFELWRTYSIEIPDDSSDATGDEMFKVAESVIPTAGSTAGITTGSGSDYSNGYLTEKTDFGGAAPIVIFDGTPNTPYLVEPLYTNPTTGDINGLGIANANTAPPLCADVFTFKGRTYYCNTQEVERLQLQIIGTGTGSATNPGGIQAGDTFFVNGVGFCWVNSTAPSGLPGYVSVALFQSGATEDKGSIAQNITETGKFAAQAINEVFNEFANYIGITTVPVPPVSLTNQLWAVADTVNELGGFVTLTGMVPGSPHITVTAGVGSGRGWNGALATNNVSDSNRQPANLMQSQLDDPESVPPAFTNTVGVLEKPILRGIGLRDSAFVFKGAGDGLWKFTDDGTGTLVIGPLDQTVHCVAPETVVSLDNTCFALCDKGVLQITDGGSPVNLSDARIQEDLAALMQRVGPDTLARLAFAVGYESQRTYVLSLPETPNATCCTVQYVYNLQTDAWTRWTVPNTLCGGIAAAGDLLVLGRTDALDALPTLYVERKSMDDTDFVDPDDAGIAAQITFLPLTGGDPLYEKQYQNVYWYFHRTTVPEFEVSYATEKQQSPQGYPMPGPEQLPWLYSEELGFGLAPWGGPAYNVIRKLALDQKAARCCELTLSLATNTPETSWTLSAVRIPYDPSTMRAVR